jgi:hypothetical protein
VLQTTAYAYVTRQWESLRFRMSFGPILATSEQTREATEYEGVYTHDATAEWEESQCELVWVQGT